jgi:hypothetical protein
MPRSRWGFDSPSPHRARKHHEPDLWRGPRSAKPRSRVRFPVGSPRNALDVQRMDGRLLNGTRAGSTPAEGSLSGSVCSCPHRPTAEVAGPSLRKCGFDSRWGRRLALARGLLVDNMHPHRGVAQPGKSACSGSRRSPVRIRPPRPRSRTAWPVPRVIHAKWVAVLNTVQQPGPRNPSISLLFTPASPAGASPVLLVGSETPNGWAPAS